MTWPELGPSLGHRIAAAAARCAHSLVFVRLNCFNAFSLRIASSRQIIGGVTQRGEREGLVLSFRPKSRVDPKLVRLSDQAKDPCGEGMVGMKSHGFLLANSPLPVAGSEHGKFGAFDATSATSAAIDPR
jgi:hypothetical protein